ncbi:DEAD/DEAH box helicase [Rhodohalobacter sulfatireducens]|uniref:DEAD/DEAH box helicase n=1 Tax=Rhodohalobacter sulfatireducens TaxID=2911366 RepID=A0ABS9K8W8_9BACT|nr:DEAD/DEAH box helicase [Rhodohalobacter sulfatireducens]MCG2587257.1 DEAD/DEAH box helicase [Rhodohalobacter sulfatireducens]
MSFKSLNITDPILRSLNEEGYSTPTPIQSRAIPIALEGKDLLASAQTGTGKTAAFAIPILQNLGANQQKRGQKKIRSLIVTPTRELAIQIDESFKSYGRYTGLYTTVVYGGVSQKRQVKQLKNGVDILTATPGRLLDLMNQRHISLSDVEVFVLDEADRMLDMGFIHDIKKIRKALPNKHQTLFFSATLPNSILKLANSLLHNPAKVEIEPESPTVDTITQGLYFVEKGNKKNLLINILKDAGIESALVFTRTKRNANKVVQILNKKNINAEAIHGNKSQSARQRALGNFKDQKTRVLVATDIAARGIDVDELKYVINYEIPNEPETYVHRIGRTGRAGADGTALSFVDSVERAYIRDIQKLIGKQIPVIDEHEFATVNGGSSGSQNNQRPSNQGRRKKRKKRPSGRNWKNRSTR